MKRDSRNAYGEASLLHWSLLFFFVLVPFIAFVALTPAKRQPKTRTDKPITKLTLSPAGSLPKHIVSPLDVAVSGRRFYPYSVIPGGAQNAQELKNAAAHDAIVAAHYAGFNVAKTHVVRLDRDRTVYVSYRLGSRVFWTQRPLRLLKGEAILTDGKHEARVRCGNRVSETPASPTTPQEPLAQEFETPQDPGPLIVSNASMDIPLTPPPMTDIVPPKRGRFFAPPIIPVPWGGGSSSPSTSQPAATPEPGTIVLLSAGLSAIWLRRKLQNR